MKKSVPTHTPQRFVLIYYKLVKTFPKVRFSPYVSYQHETLNVVNHSSYKEVWRIEFKRESPLIKLLKKWYPRQKRQHFFTSLNYAIEKRNFAYPAEENILVLSSPYFEDKTVTATLK